LSIVFTNVSCSYETGSVGLHGFNLAIPTGSRVALAGTSGCGKSTVASLLLRFREYDGSITIGGRELRHLPADELRLLIAAQLQTPHIFNTTIRDNLIIARPDATADEIASVLHDAVLDEWVAGLDEGLATRVGEGGCAISGGEARRIAVARALLKDGPLLILDEPTEGLDVATEQKMLERIDHRLRGRSLLLITHRPGPLKIVDRVVRMAGPSAAKGDMHLGPD
jgi:ATP-binding cassette subfamily C protein CydC